MMVGEREGEESVDNLLAMERELLELGHPADNLHAEIVPDGEHHETLWRAHFARAISWLFAAN
jgi:hypothetical protein